MPKSRLLALAVALLLTVTEAQASLESAAASPVTASLPTTTPVSLWSEIATAKLPKLTPGEAWVRIDLDQRELAVLRNGQRLLVIPYLAIGTAGASRIRLQGSSQTPIGEFHVVRVNRRSRFELFFGIDYPTPEIAHDAWRNGILSDREYRNYMSYHRRYGIPPANTPLGGHIGIHGLGERPARIHRIIDWTEGCVAVTNAEIQALDRFVDIGTLVVIR
ncbi:MAG TPA: L,D-transpeptidase [Modicisalibacter sp.]|nr:L,D-transpeptidase [Modicisalibacter sp.]